MAGRTIAEVLVESATESQVRTPAAHKVLITLPGGERRRLKPATHMAGKGGVYVPGEPATGLTSPPPAPLSPASTSPPASPCSPGARGHR
jgi:hypothetical protein